MIGNQDSFDKIERYFDKSCDNKENDGSHSVFKNTKKLNFYSSFRCPFLLFDRATSLNSHNSTNYYSFYKTASSGDLSLCFITFSVYQQATLFSQCQVTG